MKTFNLAEEKIVERAYCRLQGTKRMRQIWLFGFISIIVVSSTLYYRHLVFDHKSELQVKADDAIRLASASEEAMRMAEKDKALLLWTRQLSEESKKKILPLDAVLKCLPNNAWLNKVALNQGSEIVNIEGQAETMESLWTFIAGLKTSNVFTAVRLQNSDNVSTPEGKRIRFTLICDASAIQSATTTTAQEGIQSP